MDVIRSAGSRRSLHRFQKALDTLAATFEGDLRIGVNIIRRALEQPLRTLCENAGLEGSVVVESVKKEKKYMGFDGRGRLKWVALYYDPLLDRVPFQPRTLRWPSCTLLEAIFRRDAQYPIKGTCSAIP